MLSVACVSSADDPRVIIPTRKLMPLWKWRFLALFFNPIFFESELVVVVIAIWCNNSRRHVIAAFASALQSCDELQYGDVVIRFFSAEAGTSITSRLNPIYSFKTGYLSITISFSLVRFTSVSSPMYLFRWHVSSYIYFRGKHVLPAEMSSSIIANTSSMTLLQGSWWRVFVSGVSVLKRHRHITRQVAWYFNSVATIYPTVSLFSTFQSCIRNALVLSSSVRQSSETHESVTAGLVFIVAHDGLSDML